MKKWEPAEIQELSISNTEFKSNGKDNGKDNGNHNGYNNIKNPHFPGNPNDPPVSAPDIIVDTFS